MEGLGYGGSYPAGGLVGEVSWAEAMGPGELADVLRSSMRSEYGGASDQEMSDALESVLESMSPAEAFNFGSALSQIGKSAGRLVSDPTFIKIAQTAAPIAGGALGAVVGGPLGGAVGSQLGNLAASALAPQPAPPAAAAVAVAPPAVPRPAAGPPAVGAPVPSVPAPPPPGAPGPVPSPASAVAGGSTAAAQGLVLTQQPDVLRSLLATALGQHGRQSVSGIPTAQVLGLLSQVLGQAAADADALMYLGPEAEAAESVLDEAPGGSVRSLYADLLGADNLELAEAAEWAGLDQ